MTKLKQNSAEQNKNHLNLTEQIKAQQDSEPNKTQQNLKGQNKTQLGLK